MLISGGAAILLVIALILIGGSGLNSRVIGKLKRQPDGAARLK
jgi:hypothetical protein